MFNALDDFGKRVPIHRAKKGNSYYCPLCKCQLIVRKGEERVPHFAHKGVYGETTRECAFSNYSPMTDWHFDWQNMFPEENIEIIREKDGKRHIADVLIGNVVIEFQHSKISIEEFRDRNEFFTSLGLTVIWVFDMVDLVEDKRIIQDPHYNNEYQFNWAHPKKLFKQMNLAKEQCQIYFQLSDGEDAILQRVTKSYRDFKVFITDKYHSYTLDEFIKKATANPKELFYYPATDKTTPATVSLSVGEKSKQSYSTLTELWKEDTKWMIALNNETGIAYNFRYSPQISLVEHGIVFAQREERKILVNGQQRYTFYSNDVPLIGWNNKIWSVIAMTTKQPKSGRVENNLSSCPCFTIKELMALNPSVDEIKVKNTVTNKRYLLKFIQENPNISLRKVYPLLLNEFDEILYLIETDKDYYYSHYCSEKVWIQIK